MARSLPFLIALSTCASSVLAKDVQGTLPACTPVQYAFPPGTGGDATRAAAVKEAYLHAWKAYDEYAFGQDELQPLSKKGSQDWYGWGVTIIDGIDTAIIMNLTDVVAKQLAHIASVDFTTTKYSKDVEMFDVTIRYLGGLLSAYDLIKSGQFYTGYNADHVEALLKQATVLANKLAYGFKTPSGINAAYVNFTTNTPVEVNYTTSSKQTYNATNTASAGSYLVEWYRLADLTGNQTYRALVDGGEHALVNPVPAPTYPGLVGTQFDTTTGRMLNFDGGWHAGVDSFLEYLIKIRHYRADATTAAYADFWSAAATSTAAHLAIHPAGRPGLTFLSELDVNGTLTYTQDDYSCFAGGNLLLGCRVLGQPHLCDLGVAIADGCHQTYNVTTTGLGPFAWGWYDAATQTFPPDSGVDVDASYRAWAAKYGFFVLQGGEGWYNFPESLESWFYAHRITGDARWADYVWDAFVAINTTGRNNVAFAGVNNVAMPFGGSQEGSGLDSFFFAEVLKYIYLTFAAPDVVNLNEWVLNTECHPVRVPCT